MGRLSFALALLAITTGPAAAQIYHWTDGGVDYYTTQPDDIPFEHLETARVISSTPRDGADLGDPSSETAADETQSAQSEGDDSTAPGSGRALVSTGRSIVVGASLNGVPLTLLVDTGASQTTISPAALSRAGFDSSGGQQVQEGGATGGGAVQVTVPRLDVAGAQIGPLGILAHDVPGTETDGLLGRDILAHFILTIDVGRSQATLSR